MQLMLFICTETYNADLTSSSRWGKVGICYSMFSFFRKVRSERERLKFAGTVLIIICSYNFWLCKASSLWWMDEADPSPRSCSVAALDWWILQSFAQLGPLLTAFTAFRAFRALKSVRPGSVAILRRPQPEPKVRPVLFHQAECEFSETQLQYVAINGIWLKLKLQSLLLERVCMFQMKWKDYIWEIDTGGEDIQLEGRCLRIWGIGTVTSCYISWTFSERSRPDSQWQQRIQHHSTLALRCCSCQVFSHPSVQRRLSRSTWI